MKIFIANHPAAEPKYSRAPIGSSQAILWNPGPKHHRKYIERGGQYLPQGLQSTAPVACSDMLFWGEYEPESVARIVSLNSIPRAVHHTLHPVGTPARNVIPASATPGCCINTDPYVFGDEFYYYCCKRHKNSAYNPGDIILFGTVLGKQMQFHLDTLMVVKAIRPVSAFLQSNNYYKCALDPRLYSGGLPHQTVVVGEMFSGNQNEFSFVPCHLASAGIQSPSKPVIDVTKYGFKPIKSCSYDPAPVLHAASPFASLLADVTSQGFLPAVYIDCI